MDPNLLSSVKDWQTALAGVVVIVLMGFRWFFATKKDIRDDQAGDATHNSYRQTITMLREENDRLYKIAEWRQREIERQDRRWQQFCDACRKRGMDVPELPEVHVLGELGHYDHDKGE